MRHSRGAWLFQIAKTVLELAEKREKKNNTKRRYHNATKLSLLLQKLFGLDKPYLAPCPTHKPTLGLKTTLKIDR